jgi:hypothetical protein
MGKRIKAHGDGMTAVAAEKGTDARHRQSQRSAPTAPLFPPAIFYAHGRVKGACSVWDSENPM